MAYAPTSGFTGTATINSLEYPVVEWSVDPTAVVLEYFNSLSGNHPARAATFTDLKFVITIDWDETNQPFLTTGAGVSLLPGLSLGVVKLFTKATGTGPGWGGSFWTVTSSIVTGTPQTLQRAGKIVTRVMASASGTWGAPGGAAAA